MKNYSEEFKSMTENKEEFMKKDALLEKKKKIINEMNSKILCIKCNSNERDVIFCECSHLTICRSCLEELAEEKGKSKAICPACNIMSRRFFYIKIFLINRELAPESEALGPLRDLIYI